MTSQNTVRVGYLQATGIQECFEGVVGDMIGFEVAGEPFSRGVPRRCADSLQGR